MLGDKKEALSRGPLHKRGRQGPLMEKLKCRAWFVVNPTIGSTEIFFFLLFGNKRRKFLGNHAQKGYRLSNIVQQCATSALYIRAYHKSKISLTLFGTRIFSRVCKYINGKFWFWRFFFIFIWVKMPPKGYNEKNIKSLISWSLCMIEYK